jgi:hypothetical protein
MVNEYNSKQGPNIKRRKNILKKCGDRASRGCPFKSNIRACGDVAFGDEVRNDGDFIMSCGDGVEFGTRPDHVGNNLNDGTSFAREFRGSFCWTMVISIVKTGLWTMCKVVEDVTNMSQWMAISIVLTISQSTMAKRTPMAALFSGSPHFLFLRFFLFFPVLLVAGRHPLDLCLQPSGMSLLQLTIHIRLQLRIILRRP